MTEKHEDKHAGAESAPSSDEEDNEAPNDSNRSGGLPAASERAPSAGPSRGPAYFALLVAVGALGGVAWLWWQDVGEPPAAATRTAELEQRLERQVGALRTRIDEVAAEAREREERVTGLRDRLDRLDESRERLASVSDGREQRVAGLRERVDELARQRSDGESRLDSLEQRIDRLGGDVESLSNRFDVRAVDAAQIASLLTVADLLATARTRVEVSGDFEAAAAAYRLASERLEAMDAVRFDRLRERVAAEREAVAAVSSPDWASLSGTLATLADGAGRWPRAGVDEPSAPVPGTERPDDGWWSGVRSSLGQLVRITPPDRVSMDDAAFEALRERIRLHLVAAQMAAARHDAALLSHHADRAKRLLKAHFQSSNAAVSSALETLEAMSATEAPDVPELGSALDELQRLLDAS